MVEGYTFDDFLLVPQYSEISHRAAVSLDTVLCERKLRLPVLSSPMDTITESEMLLAMHQAGGMGFIHRFMEPGIQVAHCNEFLQKCPGANFGVAVGLDMFRVSRLVDSFLVHGNLPHLILCIDVAHGHQKQVGRFIEDIKLEYNTQYSQEDGTTHYPIEIIAGSVATVDGAKFLLDHGADGVRVGVGGGSICSTRLQTGHGVPQGTAIEEIVFLKKSYSFSLIADGGLRTSGDIAKALALGADAVMLGSMLAGSSATPGPILTTAQGGAKTYRGMASREAQRGLKKDVGSIEGVSALVPYKGETGLVLKEIADNLRSAFSYSGAATLKEFQAKAKKIRVTTGVSKENDTHIKETGHLVPTI